MYAEGDKSVSLGESLVKAGYARLVNWGLEMMSLGAHSLREAERNAKQQRVAIWRNYVAPASAGQLPAFGAYSCLIDSTLQKHVGHLGSQNILKSLTADWSQSTAVGSNLVPLCSFSILQSVVAWSYVSCSLNSSCT